MLTIKQRTPSSQVDVNRTAVEPDGRREHSLDQSGTDVVVSERRTDPAIAIIDRRSLYRDCFASALKSAGCDEAVLSFGTVEEWTIFDSEQRFVPVILLCAGAGDSAKQEIEQWLELLLCDSQNHPVILVSEADEVSDIVEFLNRGVRGYLLSDVTLGVAVEAIRLVRAGGIYVPPSSLLSLGRSPERPTQTKSAVDNVFTARQAAVLQALRQGKANKLIAYELEMRESTVKVHVRNIMRRLGARNRTEIAYLTNNMFFEDDRTRSLQCK